MTPAERKQKVSKLREEHQPYFNSIGEKHALYIPKMAYRPTGKDELYVINNITGKKYKMMLKEVD